MLRLTWTASRRRSRRFFPWKRISPALRAPGTVSCMRLIPRSNVDLPHPDGPMIAVTPGPGKARLTSFSTCLAPNQAE